ncbi:hypothetical protein BKA56DRAFT_78797 [Ilyonectria sp. MPI-CAGE-AT-0026]|nr:hypothetical protein BKA56DRAFT_78797 [Ilyonectria sp. MPI-CAGE-AT-0026]
MWCDGRCGWCGESGCGESWGGGVLLPGCQAKQDGRSTSALLQRAIGESSIANQAEMRNPVKGFPSGTWGHYWWGTRPTQWQWPLADGVLAVTLAAEGTRRARV